MFTSHSLLSCVSHAYTPAHMVEIITLFYNICYKKQYVFSIPGKGVQEPFRNDHGLEVSKEEMD